MIHNHPESEESIPQLLDTVEKKLNDIAETLRYSMVSSKHWVVTNSPLAVRPMLQHSSGFELRYDYLVDRWVTDSSFVQIDDTILKLSEILKKARIIRNCLAPVNRIPPETLALSAAFLVTERDLINSTAVCRQWRTVLLSFPRLWYNAGGFSLELEAYLERSKSIPLEVTLSSPHLVALIIPHTSRLVALTISVVLPSSFNEIAEHLCDPIPTLRSLEIRTNNHQFRTLELSPGLREGLFRHLESLSLNAITSLHGSHTFPHITELSLCTNENPYILPTDLLDILKRLPGLVKVSVVFQASWYAHSYSPNITTLSFVREVHLRAFPVDESRGSASIPPILGFLELPRATSITLESGLPIHSMHSILPITSFGIRLPNYVELPELRIDTAMSSGEAVFRSPQAVFTYRTGPLDDYKRERQLWGDLPVSSVRRVTAVLVDPALGCEDVWLVDMLGDPDFLELLELGGDCGWVLQRLRHRLVRGVMRVDIKALVVRGGEYAKSQALKLESVKDDLGLKNMTVTYIPDPEAYEGLARDINAESSSDDEDRGEGPEKDSDYGDDNEDVYSDYEDDDNVGSDHEDDDEDE